MMNTNCMNKTKALWTRTQDCMLPFRLSWLQILKSKAVVIIYALLNCLFIVCDIVVAVKINTTTSTQNIQFYFVGFLIINTIMAIMFFTILTYRLFIFDIKDRVHKVELRYGYSPRNFFFSRLLIIIITIGISCLFELIVGAIFYASLTSGSSRDFIFYKLFITPVGWTCMIEIMCVFISLLFAVIFTERAGIIITPIFLLIITIISVISPNFIHPRSEIKTFSPGPFQNKIYYTPQNYAQDANYFQIASDFNTAYTQPANQMILQDISDAYNQSIDQATKVHSMDIFIHEMRRDQHSPLNSLLNKLLADANQTIFVNPKDYNYQTLSFYDALASYLIDSHNTIIEVLQHTYQSMIINYDSKNGFFQDDQMLLNHWPAFVQQNLYQLLFKTYCVFQDKDWVAIGHNLKLEFVHHIKRGLFLNFLLDPLTQINQLFFGTNYDNKVMADQFNTQTILLNTSPNINFDVTAEVNTSGPYSNIRLISVNVKEQIFPTEALYVVYTIFMGGGICLLYYPTKRKIQA